MNSKILPWDELAEKLAGLRTAGKKVVFTNGCFDILHAGHVRYLSDAKQRGDILVVGLNSDASVRKIKGEKRPVVEQDQRAVVLAGLWCVDFIAIFDESDPLSLIETLRPDVLVKGADWKEDEIIGGDFVKANGGSVERIPFVADISTSDIIRKIVENYRTERLQESDPRL